MAKKVINDGVTFSHIELLYVELYCTICKNSKIDEKNYFGILMEIYVLGSSELKRLKQQCLSVCIYAVLGETNRSLSTKFATHIGFYSCTKMILKKILRPEKVINFN